VIARKSAVVLAAALLPLSLSACGSSQTVDEACDIARAETKAAEQQLTTLDATDPAASAKTVDQLAKDLEKSSRKIDNPEVKEVFDNMTDSFKDFAKVLDESANAGTDQTKLTDASTKLGKIGDELGKQGEAFQKLCGKS